LKSGEGCVYEKVCRTGRKEIPAEWEIKTQVNGHRHRRVKQGWASQRKDKMLSLSNPKNKKKKKKNGGAEKRRRSEAVKTKRKQLTGAEEGGLIRTNNFPRRRPGKSSDLAAKIWVKPTTEKISNAWIKGPLKRLRPQKTNPFPWQHQLIDKSSGIGKIRKV